MTKKYQMLLPKGARIINYAEKATARDCDICGHTPVERPPKPGYPTVSEPMRLLRVKLPAGVSADEVRFGRTNFTVTGSLIEVNVCADSQACRDRAVKITNADGSPKYDQSALARFL
jgi:hypothetical protein